MHARCGAAFRALSPLGQRFFSAEPFIEDLLRKVCNIWELFILVGAALDTTLCCDANRLDVGRSRGLVVLGPSN